MATVVSEAVALSHAQEGWTNANLPIGAAWVPLVRQIDGYLDFDALSRRFEEFMERHPVLRSRYFWRDGQFFQQFGAQAIEKLEVEDLSHVADAELAIWRRYEGLYRSYRDVEDARFSVVLFKLADDRHLLCGAADHILYDGASDEIFEANVVRGDGSGLIKQGVPTKALRRQYRDFVLWEKQWLSQDYLQRSTAQWVEKFKCLKVELVEPKADASLASDTEQLRFEIGMDTLVQLRDVLRRNKATLAMVVHTVLAAGLARVLSDTKAMLGTVWNGRPIGFESAMGCFVQLRPFLVDLNGDPDLETMLENGRRAFMDAAASSRPISSKTCSDYGVGRFRINYQRAATPANPPPVDQQRGHTSRPTMLNRRLRRYFAQDAHFAISQTETAVKGHITCRKDVIDRQKLRRLVEHAFACLHSTIHDPKRRWSDL